MKPAFDSYVKSKTAVPIYADAADTRGAIAYLLWGDGVRYLPDPQTNGRRRVRARGRTGWVRTSALGGKSLLELYFIDVCQGHGVLVKTPDFRHLLIDGGYPRAQRPSRKSAADFVDWKFVKDYGSRTIELDGMIASHNDFDHHGGLDDLLDAAQNAELDAKAVTVERFFHAGVSWRLTPDGRGRTLGRSKRKAGKEYLIDLLNDRASAKAAIDGTPTLQLQGAWRYFIQNVVAAKDRAGNPTPIARLSQRASCLPGFEPGTAGPVIHVLAPIEHDSAGLFDGARAFDAAGRHAFDQARQREHAGYCRACLLDHQLRGPQAGRVESDEGQLFYRDHLRGRRPRLRPGQRAHRRDTIPCATMNEGDASWSIRTVKLRS